MVKSDLELQFTSDPQALVTNRSVKMEVSFWGQ